MAALLGLVLLDVWSRWRSDQGVAASFLVEGQQVPAGVGTLVWSATVPASCLLVGRCSSPAPGDRVSPGLLAATRVKGASRSCGLACGPP